MKTTLYRPGHTLDTLTLLRMTTELLLNDARISNVMLHMAPGDMSFGLLDPEDTSIGVPSDHERIEKGWREILPNRNQAKDLYDLVLAYGWTREQVNLITFTCEAAAKDLRERAPEVPLSGTRRSMKHAAGMLDELALRWQLLLKLHDDEEDSSHFGTESGVVWLAIHDAHEQTVWVGDSERAAYEALVRYAYESVFAGELPENGEIEDITEIWNAITGTEYMRVEGPKTVFHFNG